MVHHHYIPHHLLPQCSLVSRQHPCRSQLATCPLHHPQCPMVLCQVSPHLPHLPSSSQQAGQHIIHSPLIQLCTLPMRSIPQRSPRCPLTLAMSQLSSLSCRGSCHLTCSLFPLPTCSSVKRQPRRPLTLAMSQLNSLPHRGSCHSMCSLFPLPRGSIVKEQPRRPLPPVSLLLRHPSWPPPFLTPPKTLPAGTRPLLRISRSATVVTQVPATMHGSRPCGMASTGAS